jgi:L-2-hydroxyglutarate oxidase LhgO
VDSVECIVVGAGVVGLSVARALALQRREVVVLEAASAIGTETSSRNSEVIHAGIYYASGSLKARLCVPGKQALYAYCDERGIPHKRCGKLIVAIAEDEIEQLYHLRAQAAASGVHDLQLLSAREAAKLEPHLRCFAALHSPSTGIVDAHAFMMSLQADAEAAGALVVLQSSIVGGRLDRDGTVVHVSGSEPTDLRCRLLVNCGGLHATRLLEKIEGYPAAAIPTVRYAKGNYFALSGRSPFNRLIYPVPVAGGLGIHLTLDLAGNARFGPDVEWVDELDYGVDPSRASAFEQAVRRYWPLLQEGWLYPAYSGIRPKIFRAGSISGDFIIEGASTNGVPGLINLFGIESPGLTAAMAIGDYVSSIAADGA